MSHPSVPDRWTSGNSYDLFMGRWSRLAAFQFLDWLKPAPGLRWLELGCGTGALTSAIVERAGPETVFAIDPSPDLVASARIRVQDERVTFAVGTAEDTRTLGGLDVSVSGLVLNFIGDPVEALRLASSSLVAGGAVAAYVWDYQGGLQFLRVFWDQASAMRREAAELDEARRFPLCSPDPLRLLFESAGLSRIEVTPLVMKTRFRDFSDFWEPFLGGTGPAPSYVASLDDDMRLRLERSLRSRLAPEPGVPFTLDARAWAIRGTK